MMKIKQMGRSMIEMLGVLAIIGTLSIGGLAAYRQIRMMHTANKIARMINLAGFTFKELCTTEKDDCPFGLYHISPQFCNILIEKNFTSLSAIEIRGYIDGDGKSLNLKATNGQFSQQDKQKLHEICDFAENGNGTTTLYFAFSPI